MVEEVDDADIVLSASRIDGGEGDSILLLIFQPSLLILWGIFFAPFCRLGLRNYSNRGVRKLFASIYIWFRGLPWCQSALLWIVTIVLVERNEAKRNTMHERVSGAHEASWFQSISIFTPLCAS